MRPASLVLLNPAAHGGSAAEQWRRVRAAVTSYSRPRVVPVGQMRLARGTGRIALSLSPMPATASNVKVKGTVNRVITNG